AAGAADGAARGATELRFEVTLAPGVAEGPVSGRLLVVLEPGRGRRGREPRLAIGETEVEAAPVLGRDVGGLKRGEAGAVEGVGWAGRCGREPDRKFPLRVHMGGYGSRFRAIPGVEVEGSAFRRAWLAEEAPRMLMLILDGAGPLGDPYQVNSDNHGPYGDAVV